MGAQNSIIPTTVLIVNLVNRSLFRWRYNHRSCAGSNRRPSPQIGCSKKFFRIIRLVYSFLRKLLRAIFSACISSNDLGAGSPAGFFTVKSGASLLYMAFNDAFSGCCARMRSHSLGSRALMLF